MRPSWSPSSWAGILISAVFGLLAGLTAPACGVEIGCGNATGYDIRFSHHFESIPSIPADRCSDTFKCAMPESVGPLVQKIDAGCDAEAGACGVRLVFPLEFRGNRENVDDVGLSLAPTPVVYWFDGAADPSCEPWIDAECAQVGICGQAFAKIAYDVIDTYLNLGTASCADPVPSLHPGTFSILAASCPSRFSCPKRTFDSFEVTTAAVKKGLGCVTPPEEACNGDAGCTQCLAGGVGVGGGAPGVGGPGSPRTGPGARLRYTGGGAGFPGLPGSAAWSVALGRGWSHDYAERIVPFPSETRVWLLTRYGTYREWSSLDGMTGVYGSVAPSSEKRTLRWLGVGAGWELTGLDGTVDLFDDQGFWLSSTDRNGNAKTATYSGSELTSVAFPDGRREDFTYDAGTGKLASIEEVGVDGITARSWAYTWTGDDLARIDRPDGTALRFTYGDAAHPGYLTRMELEGTDGTSVRVLRGWEYDAQGTVTRTWAGDASPTGPDAVDVWSLAFDDPAEPAVTTVTDPLGQLITYQLGRDTVSDNVQVLSISGDCPVCGVGPNAQLGYDDANNPLLPTSIVNGRGTPTSFTYDAFGQTLTRTEADGDPSLQRMTTWSYDASYPALVTSVEQPSVAGGASTRTTDWTLDASGNATDRTITGVEAGSAYTFTTTTSYNAAGQPLVIDPPGHGTDDQTSFTYDPARGNLFPLDRTDPIVGATTLGYDAFNRRNSVTGPSGVATTTAYDELDRVTEIRQEGASSPADDLVTTHAYTVFGDLFQTTLPAGNVIEYGYDAAGRLTSVERKPDAATPGERVLYTLDPAGNRTLEELQRWHAGTSVWVTESSTAYEYGNRCQVDRIVQAPGSPEEAVTAFEYDCNGNLSAQWDANHDAAVEPPTTSYTYDALDRLTAVSQPWAAGGNAVTSYAYDVQDHLVEVTDAEGNATSYTYSDRDLLTQEVSPVSGTTAHAYDEHGELTTTTDARGITVTRSVDALDRVTFVDYPDDALDTTYTYDTAPAGCGGTSFPVDRLGSITRNGQAVESCYDRFGRTTQDGELTYLYDANGNRTGIGYPGGVSATYGFDLADREASLSVTSPGGTEPVVSAASYLPSGPLSSLALGSGATETRTFDGRYVPTAIGLSGNPTSSGLTGLGAGVGDHTWSYTTDGIGNVLEIVERQVCPAAPLQLQNETITTTQTLTHCSSIEAGPAYVVGAGGDVTFEAAGSIVLQDGFSVLTGGSFTAISAGSPELSRRTYAYQDPQYFLTAASLTPPVGTWGTLNWTYDKIGNRLFETRDGTTDGYVYTTNGVGGHTPILDLINLGVGGTRDYTWGTAGHLEQVAAGANVLDFGADAEGRLSGVTRTAASQAASFTYDSRSFLRRAEETQGGTASVEPLYDSAGRLHALRRQASPTDPVETTVFLYLAGRPVAQLTIDGSGTVTWTYLTTDHLGTPLLATDATGTVVWQGGFEPFGTDYQAGTPAGASENGLYLRLPGQWDHGTWSDATSGAGVYYNVHRWYAPGVGRYTRPDPFGITKGNKHTYLYAQANPLSFIDPLGLVTWRCNVAEVSIGAGVGASGFFAECDSGCVDGRRVVGGYAIGAAGLGLGVAFPAELGNWDLEDGADTPDAKNLEGPFSYRGCSITPGIGFSVSEVNQGKGHGSFSVEPSLGLGVGCQVQTGGSKLVDIVEGCCYEGDGPIIRAP